MITVSSISSLGISWLLNWDDWLAHHSHSKYIAVESMCPGSPGDFCFYWHKDYGLIYSRPSIPEAI